jgi:hypothetical protein
MRSLSVCLLLLAVTALFLSLNSAIPVVAQQQDPSTPADRGLDPDEAIEIPAEKPEDNDDQDGPGSITTTETDPQEQWFWVSRFIHNNSGVGQPGPGNGTGRSISFLTIQAKSPEPNEEGEAAANDKRYRVVVEKVRKRRNDDTWTDWQEVDKKGKEVEIALDEPLKYCEVLEVRMRIESQVKVQPNPTNRPRLWVWEKDTNGDDVYKPREDDKTTFNVINLLTAGGLKVEAAAAGNDPAGDGTGGAGQQGTIGYMFDDLVTPPNLEPTSIGDGEYGTFDAPDIIFSERHSWRIPGGDLRVFATGGASFCDQSNLEVIARDVTGADAIASMDVAFGTPSVINGMINLPVIFRNPESLNAISVMIRGAEVEVPGFLEGTTIRYGFGGVPASRQPIRMPALLQVGTAPESYVYRSHAKIEVEYTHPDFPEDEGMTSQRVGWYTFMARPYTTAEHIGYTDAIVIGEPEAGHIRGGTFEITPLDAFAFMATEDTKLLVLNADDYTESSAFDDGSIEVTSTGAIRVTLGMRASSDSPILLMILNPKLNMGYGPFTAKQSGRVAIGGEALRGGFQRAVRIVEPDFGTEADHHLLPENPLVPTQLVPLAQVDPS